MKLMWVSYLVGVGLGVVNMLLISLIFNNKVVWNNESVGLGAINTLLI